MSENQNQQGFTIAELLVAIAVSAIASLLMITAFVYTYGSVVVEQTKASMVRDSQLFLRRIVEDIRLSNSIETTNAIVDSYNPSGTPSGGPTVWTTSDPANIIIATVPATDSDNNFIYDATSGEPYYHEVVYYGSDGVMYRRLLANPLAVGSSQVSSCPIENTGCVRDIKLVEDLENMLFEFHDEGDAVTTVPEDARSVQITINLRRQVYGQDITTTNTTRITLRNE